MNALNKTAPAPAYVIFIRLSHCPDSNIKDTINRGIGGIRLIQTISRNVLMLPARFIKILTAPLQTAPAITNINPVKVGLPMNPHIRKPTPRADMATPMVWILVGKSFRNIVENISVKMICDCINNDVSPAGTPNFIPMNARVNVNVPKNNPICKMIFKGKPSLLMKNINGKAIAVYLKQVKNIGSMSCNPAFVITKLTPQIADTAMAKKMCSGFI